MFLGVFKLVLSSTEGREGRSSYSTQVVGGGCAVDHAVAHEYVTSALHRGLPGRHALLTRSHAGTALETFQRAGSSAGFNFELPFCLAIRRRYGARGRTTSYQSLVGRSGRRS